MAMTSSARVPPAELLLQDLAGRVVVVEVVRGDGPERAQELDRGVHVGRDLLGVLGQHRRQAVDPVDPDRPDPGQVVESDVLELDPLGRHAEPGGQLALEPDRHVAQADRPVTGVEQRLGDDPDRVGEVHDPGIRCAPPADVLGQLQDDRHGPQRLGKTTRSGRLLADAAEAVRQRLVRVAGLLTADPQLDQDERRPVDRLGTVGGADETARPALATEDSLGQPAHDREALAVDVVEDELVDRERVRPVDQALDQLRGVGAAAADDGDLQAHRPSLVGCPSRGLGLDNRPFGCPRLVITLSATPVER